MRKPLIIFLVSSFTSVLAACGTSGGTDAGAPPGIDASGPTIVLGTGESNYVELAEGSDIELVSGPQGGYHVSVSAQIYNLEPAGIMLEFDAVPVGGTDPISMPFGLVLRENQLISVGSYYLRVGDNLVMMEALAPTDIAGMEVVLTVRAEDVNGLTAEDSRQVTIVDRIIEDAPG